MPKWCTYVSVTLVFVVYCLYFMKAVVRSIFLLNCTFAESVDTDRLVVIYSSINRGRIICVLIFVREFYFLMYHICKNNFFLLHLHC